MADQEDGDCGTLGDRPVERPHVFRAQPGVAEPCQPVRVGIYI